MWPEKHGKNWRIRDRVAGRVITIESGFRTKKAAKNRCTNLESDKLRGTDLIPRGGETLLNVWLDVWQPTWEAGLKATSRHSEPLRINNHIRPLLGHLALKDITSLAVQQWVARLLTGEPSPHDPPKLRRKPLAAKTVRNCHGLLYAALQAAVRAKLIPANACADTNLPENSQREMRFLTEPEFQRVLAAAPQHWRPLIFLLGTTGLRWGEAIGLTVQHVDLLATPPKIRVEQQLQELSTSAEMLVQTLKTRESKRTVTLDAKVADALVPLVAGKPRDAWVFERPWGGPVRTRNFRRTWLRVMKKAGLEGVRIHDLRHTNAAWLISAGAPLTGIQKRLGHTSIAITSDLYGHLLPIVDENISAAIQAAIAGIGAEMFADEVRAELGDELLPA